MSSQNDGYIKKGRGMATYVDNMQVSWRGKLWCHLVADSLDELHEFAAMLNLPRSWFHKGASYPHYDVTTEFRIRAIEQGANEVNSRYVLGIAKELKIQHIDSRKRSQDSAQAMLF